MENITNDDDCALESTFLSYQSYVIPLNTKTDTREIITMQGNNEQNSSIISKKSTVQANQKPNNYNLQLY